MTPTRRDAIASMGAGLFGAYGVGTTSWEKYRKLVEGGQQPARFFSDAETATLRVLADMIIPRDAKSGSATDSGAIEYMDFVAGDSSPRTRQIWHDGIQWFNDESNRRFGKPFAQAADTERSQIFDLVAWPARASADLHTQVDFFNRLRDLTASAFFSSRMGVVDLDYKGGVFNPGWNGAPDAAARELGVSYAEWDAKYGRDGRDGRDGGARAPHTPHPASRTPRPA
ncbi:MAG TPA: gluconate 2-dehydrogenase subunit 3 family protein [Gemmatimonadales bacterium]